jgi:hypothetical protein
MPVVIVAALTTARHGDWFDTPSSDLRYVMEDGWHGEHDSFRRQRRAEPRGNISTASGAPSAPQAKDPELPPASTLDHYCARAARNDV